MSSQLIPHPMNTKASDNSGLKWVLSEIGSKGVNSYFSEDGWIPFLNQCNNETLHTLQPFISALEY